jgi:hypothetical protein
MNYNLSVTCIITQPLLDAEIETSTLRVDIDIKMFTTMSMSMNVNECQWFRI